MEKYGDIGLVIFDFDGTIAHLKVDWESLKRELNVHFKRFYDFDSDFASLYQEIDRLSGLLGEKAREEALAIIEKYEVRGVENLGIIPETVKLMEKLKDKGIKLALFSSNTRKAVEMALMKIDKLGFFESIVTIEDVSKNKPDPEGLIKILRACKVSESGALFIGDRQRDLEAGKRAGIKTMLIKELL